MVNTFAERLIYARKACGHTQESLANAIGVSRGVTNNLELGRTVAPQPIVINAICNELGIRKEWLLCGTGEMSAPGCTRSSKELHEVIDRLSEPQRLFLLDTIRAMQKLHTEDSKQDHQTRSVDSLIEGAERSKAPNKPTNGRAEREL